MNSGPIGWTWVGGKTVDTDAEMIWQIGEWRGFISDATRK